eukprot:GHVU01086409.1.p1 GENE.GHVU01086409.1~~GHVU01086409.1.p1  ORF type:complete len:346 (+),score=40.36 GHVU01086409.1:99-1040(+)
MSEEFVHAGSDVVLAFTYYGNREKMRLIGRESELEKQNMEALRIARQVADDTGTLMAGNICNSTVYVPDNPATHKIVADSFKEQVEWAVKGGADFIVAETLGHLGEAKLALEAAKKYGNGLPVIVNMAIYHEDKTYEGVPIEDAARQLEALGADVVGLNCARGPTTMLPTLSKIKQAVKIPVAALPVCYRTNAAHPTMTSLKDPDTGVRAFPQNLDKWHCGRDEIEWFAREAKAVGVQVLGLCCGNAAHYTRSLAEAVGRVTPASKYSPNMSEHFIYGDHKSFKSSYTGLKQVVSGKEIVHPEAASSNINKPS